MYTKTAPSKTMHHLLNVVLQITMRFIQGFYLSDQNFELSTSQQIETEKLSVKTAPSTHTESWQNIAKGTTDPRIELWLPK